MMLGVQLVRVALHKGWCLVLRFRWCVAPCHGAVSWSLNFRAKADGNSLAAMCNSRHGSSSTTSRQARRPAHQFMSNSANTLAERLDA